MFDYYTSKMSALTYLLDVYFQIEKGKNSLNPATGITPILILHLVW